jgi:hypothetical protein
MIGGYVTFYLDEDAYESRRLLDSIQGLRINGQRPKSYQLKFSEGSLTADEADRLNQWIRMIPTVLEIRKS